MPSPEQRRSVAFDCLACGRTLSFAAGSLHAWCEICEDERPLPAKLSFPLEFEPVPTASRFLLRGPTDALRTCGSCRASISGELERCPFCAAGVDVGSPRDASVSAKGWLPPRIGPKAARRRLIDACGDLEIPAGAIGFNLVFVPWAAMKLHAIAKYRGERGTVYYGANDRRRVRWESVQGTVEHPVFDTGAVCSTGLTERVARSLRDWDWPFAEAGSPPDGTIVEAVEVERAGLLPLLIPDLDDTMHTLALAEIGGDEQRVSHVQTRTEGSALRVVLVPVWTGKLAHLDRRFAVNARTGRVVVETYEDRADPAEIDRGLAPSTLDLFDAPARREDLGKIVLSGLAVLAVLAVVFAIVSCDRSRPRTDATPHPSATEHFAPRQ